MWHNIARLGGGEIDMCNGDDPLNMMIGYEWGFIVVVVVVICDKRGWGVASLDGWTIASNSTGSTLSRISRLTEFGDGHPVLLAKIVIR